MQQSDNKKRRYYQYTGAKKERTIARLKEQLPDILEQLAKLPRATGEVDQAQEPMMDFNSTWGPFRFDAMSCGLKEWLVLHVYGRKGLPITQGHRDWANRNQLKNSSTGHRKWKTEDNARRWREMPEAEKDARRQQQRAQKKQARAKAEWFNTERAIALAERCLKADPKAESVGYQPVIRMIKKHMPADRVSWAIERVLVAIRCYQWNPQDERTERNLSQALTFSGIAPEKRQGWRQFARKQYETSQQKVVNDVLAEVDADLDRMLATATKQPEQPVMISTAREPEYDATDDVSLDDDNYRTASTRMTRGLSTKIQSYQIPANRQVRRHEQCSNSFSQ